MNVKYISGWHFVIIFFLTTASSTKKFPTALKTNAELDQETEELKHEKVPVDIGRLILKGRQAKKLTQKELAIVSLSYI